MSIVRVSSLRGLNNNLDITCKISFQLFRVKLVGHFYSYQLTKLLPMTDVAIPYFNWSTVEAALIIITGSVPYLRPLMATILPDFFKSRNFTSLGGAGKAKEISAGSSSAPSSSEAPGDITITKEFHLEETDVEYGGFDSRPPSTPMTPLAPRSGPRMVVICEKVDT